MGDVIDFRSAARRMAQKSAETALRAGDECELIYDPKPDSVGVAISTDAEGVAHFTVTAPAAEVGTAVKAAKSALLQNFGVDPSNEQAVALVREQVGAATFDAFVTTFVQQHFFSKALLRTSVMPFLDPDLLTSDAPVEGQDYVFRVDALLRPTFELSSYDPVALDEVPQKRQITSKDVSQYLDNMANELATWENDPARETVELGDHVTLNLAAATPDGREVASLSGRHVPYQVGLGTIGEDFDRNLVGMKPRERRELSVSLPMPGDDGQIAYQVVQVKVQLDEIQRKVPAKIDDLWVSQNMPEAQTLLGLRGRVRTLLEREAERAYHDELMARTAEELAKRLVGEPDERYVAKMREELVTQYITDLQRQGIDYQQVMASPDFDADAWERQITDEARHALSRGFALDALADHLDIQLDEKDIAQVVAQMAPGHEQEALQGLLDSGQMPKMCEVALRMRANDWLVQNVQNAQKASPLHVVAGGAAEKTGGADGAEKAEKKPAGGHGAFEGGILLGGDAPAANPRGDRGDRGSRSGKGDGPKLTLL